MTIRRHPLSLAIAATLVLGLAACADRITSQRQTEPAPEATTAEARRVAEAKSLADLDAQQERLETVTVTGSRVNDAAAHIAPMALPAPPAPPAQALSNAGAPLAQAVPPPENTERYAEIDPNSVQVTAENPVSTFSIDVDTGSYANVRRMLEAGMLPPSDAVRAEEFINYFDYAYTPPRTAGTPFSVTTELAPAPWNARRTLMLVGLKGFEVPVSEIPAANLVFLIDTSGSMAQANKLPLLVDAFKQLVPKLRARDRVSIVVYAGSAGLVLPPTPGDRHAEILGALDRLSAGGSTNGGDGIRLAYAVAREAFVEGGVNRVILATDGDFNVGTTSQDALQTLVGDQRRSGIALTTLGFGDGNYNDALAEQLADVGNGNHAYIDTLQEARKVLVDEMSSTLLTIAHDVKVQVEFNPAQVAEYRLIGYENRLLRREDFNNDRVDAGEVGAGHDVTALYELTLVGQGGAANDPLRYAPAKPSAPAASGELAFVKLRYKPRVEADSVLVERPVRRGEIADRAGPRLSLAAAAAGFADALRGGAHLGRFGLADLKALARDGVEDGFGYREGLVALIERAQALRPEGVAQHPTVSIERED
ncbi:MAG: vWA domain-containing protein [Pseudomonadota bacterium]